MGIIEEILDLAKQCLNEHFVIKCGIFLLSSVTERNLCWSYRLSILYDLKAVRDLCELNIGANVPQMFTSDDFLECDHETLLRVLEIDALKCKEIDVFEGCIKWARAACQRKNLDVGKLEHLRVELGDAMAKIRFRSMDLRQFIILHKTYEGLFTPDEFIEITYIIGELPNFTSQKFSQKHRLNWRVHSFE